MGITKKILFGVLTILVVALLVSTLLGSMTFSRSSDRPVSSVVEALTEDYRKSQKILDSNFQAVAERLPSRAVFRRKGGDAMTIEWSRPAPKG